MWRKRQMIVLSVDGKIAGCGHILTGLNWSILFQRVTFLFMLMKSVNNGVYYVCTIALL